MKKIVSLLLILVAFSSCETDVKFSDPGLQGRKDNLIWRADLTTASFTTTDPVDPSIGELTITAYKGLEEVTLKMPFVVSAGVMNNNPLEFSYGYDAAHPENDDDIVVSYSYEDNGVTLEYITGMGYNVGAQQRGNAQIVITSYDPVKGTISGNFKFNAKYQGTSDIVPENVNFQEGAFYNIQRQ
ncbi:DUF6252 family protein [Flavobacterium pallidum]|uniref:Uncharacterized protein n=1 Tax=Flavobacterium pallidum TaxID=2172098 RepID=A0A2S1SEB6_9FLAO|nr:DUF6252 family protein [Flavobacterium pallidum]AWI24758.1 hypothetical protein HYN49_02000 [Flavobacterium pallidum]